MQFDDLVEPRSRGRPCKHRERPGGCAVVKRPLNSFMLYRQDRAARLQSQDPTLKPKQLSQMIGEDWRNETALVKRTYIDRAQQLRDQHGTVNMYTPEQQRRPRASATHAPRRRRRPRAEPPLPSPPSPPWSATSWTVDDLQHFAAPQVPRVKLFAEPEEPRYAYNTAAVPAPCASGHSDPEPGLVGLADPPLLLDHPGLLDPASPPDTFCTAAALDHPSGLLDALSAVAWLDVEASPSEHELFDFDALCAHESVDLPGPLLAPALLTPGAEPAALALDPLDPLWPWSPEREWIAPPPLQPQQLQTPEATPRKPRPAASAPGGDENCSAALPTLITGPGSQLWRRFVSP